MTYLEQSQFYILALSTPLMGQAPEIRQDAFELHLVDSAIVSPMLE